MLIYILLKLTIFTKWIQDDVVTWSAWHLTEQNHGLCFPTRAFALSMSVKTECFLNLFIFLKNKQKSFCKKTVTTLPPTCIHSARILTPERSRPSSS